MKNKAVPKVNPKLVGYVQIRIELDRLANIAKKRKLDKHLIESLEQARSEAERLKRSLLTAREPPDGMIRNPTYDEKRDMYD